ncbi:hypothetical protein E2562_003855 [Oryza meyeriana var. granulata]|uniref:Uncharacterized protein n=1 Tax=Oryza meyeriana var. granulata TaxID=110450 RepID=A0A6G1CZD1_9ORYZ|nr:hypothetical protein E2562_003855 [Oryza meyeriana var. granulata]
MQAFRARRPPSPAPAVLLHASTPPASAGPAMRGGPPSHLPSSVLLPARGHGAGRYPRHGDGVSKRKMYAGLESKE